MDTLKILFIVSLLVASAVAGCSPAHADLNAPTASNTKLTSSLPTSSLTASAAGTPIPSGDQPISPFPTFTHTAPATSIPVPSRDLSTSSTRLVGHWGKFVDGEIDEAEQCFFGGINAEGIGEYFEVSEGNHYEGTFRIRSEGSDTAEVVFLIKSDPNEIVLPLKVSEDGLFFYVTSSEDSAEYQYMDSKTKPDYKSPVVKKYKFE